MAGQGATGWAARISTILRLEATAVIELPSFSPTLAAQGRGHIGLLPIVVPDPPTQPAIIQFPSLEGRTVDPAVRKPSLLPSATGVFA